MSRFVYTEDMIEYVRKIAPGRYNDEITKMFNERFELNKTVKQISSMKRNHKITSGKLTKRFSSKLLNEEQDIYLRENVKGRSNQELADMLNKKFGLSLTSQQVKTYKSNRGLSSGLTGHFCKGHEPWNKGKKGLYFDGAEKGWFKKGQRPSNYRPVGSERVCSKDGYIIVKVQDDGAYQDRWRHKHVVEWEKHNGAVPEGYVVTFLDGDKTNTDISNLKLISRRTLSYLNKSDGLTNNPEENEARIKIAEISSKLGELSYTKGEKEKFERYLKTAEKNGIKECTFKARLRKGWSFERASKTI